MTAIMDKTTIKTLTTHYIDGAFVESHGHQMMDIIKPTNGQVTTCSAPAAWPLSCGPAAS